MIVEPRLSTQARVGFFLALLSVAAAAARAQSVAEIQRALDEAVDLEEQGKIKAAIEQWPAPHFLVQ